MAPLEHSQSGFSTPFIMILAALVIIGVGTVGVMVYHSQKTGNTVSSTVTIPSQPSKQPTAKSPNQTTQTTATQYLDIKEWGVRLTLDSDTSSLYYYIKPDLPDVAYLSLKTISDVAPDCAASKISLAAISRLTGAEQQSIVSGSTPGIPGTIHIGNYWYSYQHSNAACTDGTTAMNTAVSNAAPNYNAGTLQNNFNTLTAY